MSEGHAEAISVVAFSSYLQKILILVMHLVF